MAIDEKKLIEVLERNFGGIGGASVLKQLIEAQPKISLENKTSDWIPVEALPNEYGRYLVSTKYEGVFSAMYSPLKKYWFVYDDYYNDEEIHYVEAWQPLPQKYEG